MKVFLYLFLGLPSLAFALTNWWNEDIWEKESKDRPFLYYGEKPKEIKAQNFKPQELSKIQSIDELRLESKMRLEAAIMNPTRENIKSYQEINSFMLSKAHVFSQSWEKSRFENPQFDWTSTHPTTNAIKSSLTYSNNSLREKFFITLSNFAGLIVFIDESELSRLSLSPLKLFCRKYGVEYLLVSLTGKELFGEKTKKATPEFLSSFSPQLAPSIYLVPNAHLVHPTWIPNRHQLILSGALSVIGIENRIIAALSPVVTLKGNALSADELLPEMLREVEMIKGKEK